MPAAAAREICRAGCDGSRGAQAGAGTHRLLAAPRASPWENPGASRSRRRRPARARRSLERLLRVGDDVVERDLLERFGQQFADAVRQRRRYGRDKASCWSRARCSATAIFSGRQARRRRWECSRNMVGSQNRQELPFPGTCFELAANHRRSVAGDGKRIANSDAIHWQSTPRKRMGPGAAVASRGPGFFVLAKSVWHKPFHVQDRMARGLCASILRLGSNCRRRNAVRSCSTPHLAP